MIVIDNFFTQEQIDALHKAIFYEIETKGGKFDRYEIDGEGNAPSSLNDGGDHINLHKCDLYYIKGKAQRLYLSYLVEKKLFHEDCLDEKAELTIRYHRMKAPYMSKWHKDRVTNWESEEVDYMGVSYFLNEEWNFLDGGLYLYKESTDSSQGHYIEPVGNRIIINPKDHWHAVTRITNADVTRSSLQMFIKKDYFIG